MKPIRFIVLLTTTYLFGYSLTPYIDSIPTIIIFSLWFFGTFLLIYMVVAVLVKGIPSKRTFEEGYWYEDRDRIR
jgi:hypothetical protein